MIEIDCLGEHCPMPVIKLSKAAQQAEPGTVIRVLSDDEGSKVDIPVWARMKGHEFVGRTELPNGGWSFDVRTRR